MRLPFTVGQFLEVFADYNTAIWPAQIVAYALGALAVLLAFSKWKSSNRLISGILTLFWLWSGLVYHVFFFSSINKPAYVFGLLFIVQGVLFLYVGVIKNRLKFRPAPNADCIVGAALVTYAVLIYPLLGYALGHSYPHSPVFGVAPCPVVIFTFGILLWTDKRVPMKLLLVPVLWSLVGFSAAVFLGIFEDIALIVAGVGATVQTRRRPK